jgi:hypothetical protein
MGLGAVKRRHGGIHPDRQALWRGETVEMELEGKRRSIRMLNPGLA